MHDQPNCRIRTLDGIECHIQDDTSSYASCVKTHIEGRRCSGLHTLKAQDINGIRLLEDWHLKVEYLFFI